jgi:hypothetical protein
VGRGRVYLKTVDAKPSGKAGGEGWLSSLAKRQKEAKNGGLIRA